MKDLNRFKKYTKNQEASYNFKLGFALSIRPHFNSVYLVRVPFLTGIAVLVYRIQLKKKVFCFSDIRMNMFSLPNP